ncbi:MAG TPA: TSUP family transporter, partial [Geobacteraceae bacterium]|nr:TSUP family transporter [Geobacteraceae bacterium]
MDFLISGTHIHPLYLMGIGFVVGILGGFFGVGGSFLAGPALFAAGMPMNFVVGTDLTHIVGKSIVAAKRHRALGNVDIKLGMIMVAGTIAGVEVGAQFIEYLKRRADVDIVVAVGFIFVLLAISAFIGWESWQTLKML